MDITIFIGAGASYGAKGISPTRPPLGKDLYEELTKYSDVWRTLPSSLASIFQENSGKFEVGMQATDDYDGGTLVHRLTFDMGKYFQKFRPQSHCSYYNFFRNTQKYFDKIDLVSLNYEFVAEICAARVSRSIIYYESSRDCADFRVIKPHGSSNFLPSTFGITSIISGIKIFGGGSLYEGPIDCVTNTEKIEAYYK